MVKKKDSQAPIGNDGNTADEKNTKDDGNTASQRPIGNDGNTADENNTKGDGNTANKPSDDSDFHIRYDVLYVLLVAFVLYLYFQLHGLERKFGEINNIDYQDMLKQIKADVPGMQKEISFLKEQIGTAWKQATKLNNRIYPLEKLVNDTKAFLGSVSEDQRKIETTTTEIKQSIEKLKFELGNENTNIEILKDKVNGLELESIQTQILELRKQADDAEHELIPSIKKQEDFAKNIKAFEDKVETLITSVDTCASRMSDVENKMKANKENFDKVNKAVEQAQQLNLTVAYMRQNVGDGVTKINAFMEEVGHAESNMTKLSQELLNVSTNIIESKKILEQSAGKQQTITEMILKAEEQAKHLTHDMLNTKSDIENLKQTVSGTEQDISNRFGVVRNELFIAEQRMSSLKEEYNNSISNLTDRIAQEENFTKQYIEPTLPGLVAKVDSHINNASTPWISVIGMVDMLLIAVLFYFWFKLQHEHKFLLSDQENSTIRSEAHNEAPQRILEHIHRVPVLDSKICILSFYAETQALHKALGNSALESCRRGKTLEIVEHLVRTHGDILNIPKARYIFVFVDFNERNVILENPDQDLGDKKLVSVQACQKLGADVFVTYVRDRGSSNLVPGHLYNPDLSAFKRHKTLQRLVSDQRCFSVYEQFNTTQREHIARIIG